MERESQKKTKIFSLFEPSFSDLNERQVSGEQILFLGQEDANNLINSLSTDGILPSKGARFQRPQDLAPFALTGVEGIGHDLIKKRDVGVLLVGDRMGVGSAREHAPRSLKGAGINLVIVCGGKAEKIFKENCLFSGGPTVIEVENDVDRINSIIADIREGNMGSYLLSQTNEIEKSIIENGGLFAFTKKRLDKEISLPQISHSELSSSHPMTAIEKVLANKFVNVDPNHKVVTPGDVGFVECDLRFSYEFMTKMIDDSIKENIGDNALIADKGSYLLFEDHLVWQDNEGFTSLIQAQREISEKLGIKIYKQEPGLPGSRGICHTLIVEEALVLPGEVCIGTDSHTCSGGVLGALSFGVGSTAMANALLTKDTYIKVPETVKINFGGNLADNCSAKDVMLTMLARSDIKDGMCIDKAIEYGGEGLEEWSVDELFVLTNMAVEAGATTGIIPEPKASVINHLSEKTGIKKDSIKSMFTSSDNDANFYRTLEIDLSEVEPIVALPGNPANGVPISELGKTEVTSGFIGSCTGGKIDDIRLVAGVLDNKAVRVPLTVQPASMSIYDQAQKEGLLEIIENAGGEVVYPGCGACIGMGPGKIESEEDVIISDTNRNYPGRMGKPNNNSRGNGQVYLSSPNVVAASCVAGYIKAS